MTALHVVLIVVQVVLVVMQVRTHRYVVRNYLKAKRDYVEALELTEEVRKTYQRLIDERGS